MANQIKLDEIAQRVRFTPENTKKLIDIFYQSSHAIIETLKKAEEEKDFNTLYRSAHSLKGSALNLLFEEVGNIAKAIEHAAKEEKRINYKELIEKIEIGLDETEII